MLFKAFKYRIYPDKNQEILIRKSIGSSRFIYNWGLDRKSKEFTTTGKNLSNFDLCKLMKTELKDKEEFDWLNEIYSQSLQQSLRNLDMAYTSFFKKKSGYPKFKSKRNGGSFGIPQNTKIDFENSKVWIPKLYWIKTKISRHFEGKIKSSTISMTPSGKFYISILVETFDNLEFKEKIERESSLGIDLGIKDFAILSNGKKINNPKFHSKKEKYIKRQQKRLSKKSKGSKNYNKQRVKVAKLHEKISNQRNNFLHKLTYDLTHENQVNTIVLEDLNVSGMIKNRKLSKAIQDVSWSKFTSLLKYKCEWYGKNLIFIGRFEPSSKICSACGGYNDNLKLKDRNWTCQECGTSHDRDINAAINIRNFGLLKQNLIGQEMPEFKPVEKETSVEICL
jgi:putative transposase